VSIIYVSDLADPRLRDYTSLKERQLHADFSERGEVAGDDHAPWGKFMAEGEVVFERLASSRFRTLSVLCTPARLETIGVHLARLPASTPVYVAPAKDVEALVGFPLHRGLMAIAARERPADPVAIVRVAAERAARGVPGVVAVLEGLTNHDNIGAIFRNAAAFGVAGLLLSPTCADPLYRKAVRVSVGHALSVPFARLSPWPGGLFEVARACGAGGVGPGGGAGPGSGAVVACLSPREPATALRPGELPAQLQGRAVLLVLGSEGPGVSAEVESAADVRLRIPMAAGVDSLNVAVASALAMYMLSSGGRGF
jgi:tRNA G18 (ribose-2'-O)-methylase SpoU